MAFTSQLTTSVLQVEGRNTEGGVVEIVPGARLLLDVGVDSVEGGALLDEIAAAVVEAKAARDEAVDLSGISTPDGVIANRINTPGTETQAALSATIATAFGTRVAVFGDSILNPDRAMSAEDADGDLVEPAIVRNYFTNAVVTDALMLAGGRGYVSDNFAVRGETTAQMLARVAVAAASDAEVVVMDGGRNDLNSGRTAAQIIADLSACWDALVAAGKQVIYVTTFPATSDDAAKTLTRERVNQWAVTQQRPRVTVCAWHQAVTDGASGAPLANTLLDGTHPQTLGGLRLAKALAPTLARYIPENGYGLLPASNAEYLNALPNGLMLGVNAVSGTGYSGDIASSWEAEPTTQTTMTLGKDPRTDGMPGEWQRITFTGASAHAGVTSRARIKQYVGLHAGFTTPTTGYVATSIDTLGQVELRLEDAANCDELLVSLLYFDSAGVAGTSNALRVPVDTDRSWEDFEGIVTLPRRPTPGPVNAVFLSVEGRAKNGTSFNVYVGRNAVRFI